MEKNKEKKWESCYQLSRWKSRSDQEGYRWEHHWKIGETLSERDLAEQFQVGRMTLHELSLLVEEEVLGVSGVGLCLYSCPEKYVG